MKVYGESPARLLPTPIMSNALSYSEITWTGKCRSSRSLKHYEQDKPPPSISSKMHLHHLLTGSYTNTSLFLLAFDSISRTLTLNSTVPGYGLHQFVTSNAAKNRVYATTMSEPPRLFSWSVDEHYRFTHLDTVNISRWTSGYIVKTTI